MLYLKKISIALTFAFIISLSAISSNAFAFKDNLGGGFTGDGPNKSTIVEALKLADDSWVVLEGHIIRSLGDEKYMFKDSSAEHIVEIDNDIWRGQHIGSEDLVQILVEVEKEWSKTELEVAKISVIK